MKKILMALFIFAVLLAPAVHAEYLPSIDVILTKQAPNPAEPGQTVNLEVTIQNDGYSEAQNMVVEFVPTSPIGLQQGENAKRTFSRIPAAGSLKTTYKIYVDKSAFSDDYDLEFRVYSVATPDNYIKKALTLSVQGIPQLVIDSISTVPDNVEPGGMANIIFKIRNVGTGGVRGLKTTLASSTEKIIPVYSSSLVYIGNIGPNETAEGGVEVSVDSSAEYKTYVMTLTMNYKDESNQDKVTSFSVGIPVTGSIKLSIIKITPNYEKNRIEIELANKGTTDATSLEARLVIDGQTTDVEYLSTLKSTKKTTFNYPMIYKGNGQLVIDYVGPGLEQNQKKLDVVFDFIPQGSSGSDILLVLILLVLAFFAWRKKWYRKLLFKKK
jgi:hypothetical protein